MVHTSGVFIMSHVPARWRHNMAPRSRLRSFSEQYCAVYILPLLLSSKYDDMFVSCCDKQHFYALINDFVVDGQPIGLKNDSK